MGIVRRCAVFSAAMAVTACATVRTDHLPRAEVQPLAGALPAHASEAVEAHARWLQGASPHSAVDPDRDRRALLRLRIPESASEEEWQRTSAVNKALSQYYLSNESRYYRNGKQRPGICVALSGGGIRASAFAIGVLQGLHEAGRLQEVDIVSGVSGGAYGTTWYTDHRTRGRGDAEVLSDAYIDKTIDPALFSLPVAALGAATSFLSLLMSGAGFANGIDSSTVQNSYFGMLAGSFDVPLFGKTTMDQIRRAVVDKKIPMPIVGIAAYPLPGRVGTFGSPEDPLTAHARSVALNDTYLEVTPFRYGINGFGFHSGRLVPLRDDLWQFVLVSGAAYDRPHDLGSVERLAGPIRLGGALSLVVPKRHPELTRALGVSDVERMPFYATDGGFAENLGAYPLLMRRCETLVIADGEHDPDWHFEGYRVLRDRLKAEHGMRLLIPGIEDHINREPSVATAARADGLVLPSTDAECARPDRTEPCRARTARTNIFHARVQAFPIEADASYRSVGTDVVYLKLGLPADLLLDPGSPILRHSAECMRTPDRCYFPHDQTFRKTEPTKSQIYTKAQFTAYKELGRESARRIAWSR